MGLIFIWNRNFKKNVFVGVKFRTALDAYVIAGCSSLLTGDLFTECAPSVN